MLSSAKCYKYACITTVYEINGFKKKPEPDVEKIISLGTVVCNMCALYVCAFDREGADSIRNGINMKS